MQPAEFEEREYEAPLYNQLAAADRRVWSPGQVFEHHIGVDYGLFFDEPWIFELHGFRSPLSGAALGRYRWPTRWFRRHAPRRLPTFRLNLFLQAKRPSWSKRPMKALRAHGLTAPFWCMTLDSEQQATLEAVATRLDRRALVLYAAPTFHDHASLFRHTRLGSIAAHSTFPSALALHGHARWYYNEAGAKGVANPDYDAIEEPPLEQRLAELSRQTEGKPDWRQSLKDLAASIRAALSEGEGLDTPRRAAYFDAAAEITAATRDLPDGELIAAYLSTLAFCEIYLVSWYVVSEGT